MCAELAITKKTCSSAVCRRLWTPFDSAAVHHGEGQRGTRRSEGEGEVSKGFFGFFVVCVRVVFAKPTKEKGGEKGEYTWRKEGRENTVIRSSFPSSFSSFTAAASLCMYTRLSVCACLCVWE